MRNHLARLARHALVLGALFAAPAITAPAAEARPVVAPAAQMALAVPGMVQAEPVQYRRHHHGYGPRRGYGPRYGHRPPPPPHWRRYPAWHRYGPPPPRYYAPRPRHYYYR